MYLRRSRRKKRMVRRRMGQLLLIISTVSIIYIGQGNVKKIVNVSAMSNQEEKPNIEEYNELMEDVEDIPQEVLNSNDPIIQDLLKMREKNPNVNEILCSLSLYPEELLELASKKEEVIDFVLDYPNHESYSNKEISIDKDYQEGEIPLFIQWDKRWGYEKYGSNFIAVRGCGPTSLAMVIVGLTGNTDINPKVIADFSAENGYLIDGVGTSWELMTEGAKNFGIKGEELPLSESAIINTLKEGQTIIASMSPGTFTTMGHFLVLTGVDSNGKIIINDSDSRVKSKQTWDIDVFMKETKNLWVFTKQ